MIKSLVIGGLASVALAAAAAAAQSTTPSSAPAPAPAQTAAPAASSHAAMPAKTSAATSNAAAGYAKLYKAAQTKLKAADLYKGPIDGRRSPAYVAALKKFQADHNLKADGRLTPETRKALEI